MTRLAKITPQRKAPERAASLIIISDGGIALDAKKILEEAVETVKAIASEEWKITDILTDTLLHSFDLLPDFGAIEVFYNLDGQKPYSGIIPPFLEKISAMPKLNRKQDVASSAEFLLATIVEFSVALHKAANEIAGNDKIPENKKYSFPETLEARIATSEDSLKQLITFTRSIASPHRS